MPLSGSLVFACGLQASCTQFVLRHGWHQVFCAQVVISASQLDELDRYGAVLDILPASTNIDSKALNGANVIDGELGDISLAPRPGASDNMHGNETLLGMALSYVKAIMTPDDGAFPQLNCPVGARDRYHHLRTNSTADSEFSSRRRYFFALDLYQCADLLPRLFGSIVEAMRFLGPEQCALSVVEGRSTDGTFEVLKLLRDEIEGMGATYFLSTNQVDPTANGSHARIEALAELRNQAIKPLVDHPEQYSTDATVLFINDVALCTEDILELVHQRIHLHADMTCAMDWTYVGRDPTFYDVWIARGMNGDSFFDIPEDGNWNSAWNLFWNNPESRDRLNTGRPFQVFSCWNGATALTAKPLLEQKITFRSRYRNECYQGEPQLFCKDMWHLGYGKIAVVPSVNLEYTNEAAAKIKSEKGYVSRWVESQLDNGQPTLIDWSTTPPPLVKCIESWADQHWAPWDEALTEHELG
jgi:alpha-1,3-mannosyltransferase